MPSRVKGVYVGKCWNCDAIMPAKIKQARHKFTCEVCGEKCESMWENRLGQVRPQYEFEGVYYITKKIVGYKMEMGFETFDFKINKGIHDRDFIKYAIAWGSY